MWTNEQRLFEWIAAAEPRTQTAEWSSALFDLQLFSLTEGCVKVSAHLHAGFKAWSSLCLKVLLYILTTSRPPAVIGQFTLRGAVEGWLDKQGSRVNEDLHPGWGSFPVLLTWAESHICTTCHNNTAEVHWWRKTFPSLSTSISLSIALCLIPNITPSDLWVCVCVQEKDTCECVCVCREGGVAM